MSCLDYDGNEIQVGDKVIYYDDSDYTVTRYYELNNITVGSTYLVISTFNDGVRIKTDRGRNITFFSKRFKFKTLEKKPITKDQYDLLPNYMKDSYYVS